MLSGNILANGSDNGHSYFDIDCEISQIQDLQNQTLFALDDHARHGYAIRKVEAIRVGCRVFTKLDHSGFEARSAKTWEIPVTTFKTV